MTMTKDKLDRYRDLLTAERTRIMHNVDSLRDELSVSISDDTQESGLETHMGDVGTETFNRERDVSIEDQEERLVSEIDTALSRLDAGTYGTCIDCDAPISTHRLEALPWAVRCIDCERAT